MDRILFGDNQFFGVNHLSDEKARAQAMRFKDTRKIIDVLEYVHEIGINTFMCTTHDRIFEVCDYIRNNQQTFADFEIFPCMPYAHKYANAVTELGIIGTLKQFMGGNILGSVAKGGVALATKDYTAIMELLVDAEMSMFKGIKTRVVFLQNVVADLILGMGMTDFFVAFAQHVQKKYGAEPGFITMNFPLMLETLEKVGISNPIICSSINKVGFRMSGGKDKYEGILREKRCRAIAMQVLAAGAVPPKEAIEYVCSLEGVHSILYGASTSSHIKQTRDLIADKWSL